MNYMKKLIKINILVIWLLKNINIEKIEEVLEEL